MLLVIPEGVRVNLVAPPRGKQRVGNELQADLLLEYLKKLVTTSGFAPTGRLSLRLIPSDASGY